MRITKLTIENFKKFKNKFEFNFFNQVFFVGENNTGKTTVIDAINYLLNGKEKDKKYKNINANGSEFIIVEAEVRGDFSKIDEKYKDYVFIDAKGVACMKIRRSDEIKEVPQGGRKIKLDESKILCWNDSTKQFENPAGKDTTFNVLSTVIIYANDHVDDIVNFDTTKILGKLIKSSVGDFFDTPEYGKFKQEHDNIFNRGTNSLKSRLANLSDDISKILKEQWGELEIGFKFDIADNSSHLKKGNLLIKENGIEQELESKGSGLQRSIMLSMIQSLSKVYNSERESSIILCVDEPELNLHPRAQEKLSVALTKLSKNIQVIVSTHSPYMLKSFEKNSDQVYIFKSEQFASPELMEKISVLPFGPTLSEIQYFAYNIIPSDFHNELYGYLESENAVDFNKFCNKKEKWVKIESDKSEKVIKDVSLQYYIRNCIHHPENTKNPIYTDIEIKISIEEMIEKVEEIIKKKL